MRNYCLYIVGLLTIVMPVQGQRMVQPLNRGVVAVNRTVTSGSTKGLQGVLISWRRLTADAEGTTFNVYINNNKVVSQTAKTNYRPSSLSNGDVIRVVPVVGGKEETGGAGSFTYNTSVQSASNVYMRIRFEHTVCPLGAYACKTVYPADLDGDGETDYVCIMTSRDNYKFNDVVQAYRSDGTCLWSVDMGPNIYVNRGQNDKVLVYDVNNDGRAEVILRTSDGTRFSDGRYANGSSAEDTDHDGIVDYRYNPTKYDHRYKTSNEKPERIPPFYISVVNGETGVEMDCAELDYSKVHDNHGDSYTRDSRSRYLNDNDGVEYAFMTGHFAICYYDGVHPSVTMECLDRDYTYGHHNYVFTFSYDWDAHHKPSHFHHTHTWARENYSPVPAEFHQLRVCDVDGDGIDEMLQGGYGYNTTKGLLFNAAIGHGDRFRVSDIIPDRPGLEAYAIQQSDLLGQLLYDAATGEHLKEWYLTKVTDVGRGECMDVDASHKGYEIYSTMENLYDCHGNVISSGKTSQPFEGIWWDGNLQREVCCNAGGTGWNTNVRIQDYSGKRQIEFGTEAQATGAFSTTPHAVDGDRAAFWGDIIGDWREEVILIEQMATSEINDAGNNPVNCYGIVGYSTNIPTNHSMVTLMEDQHYRLDCQTRGYYQSPNTGFYLGEDMPLPPIHPVVPQGQLWENCLDGSMPSQVYMMYAKGQDYVYSGSAVSAPSTTLYKSMQGTATVNSNLSVEKVIISEGTLAVHQALTGDVELRARGTLAGKGTVSGSVTFEGALHEEGCRLMPTDYHSLTFTQGLTLPGRVYVEEHLKTPESCGRIVVNGDLRLSGTNYFTLHADATLAPGTYTLAECTGTLTASASNVSIRNLEGYTYAVKVSDNQIQLVITDTRAPATDVAWTGARSGKWDHSAKNFISGETATAFVSGDEVTFGDGVSNTTVTLTRRVLPRKVTFHNDNSTYHLKGAGGIGGQATVVKNGNGELQLSADESNYTGATVLNEGTLTITSLGDAGKNSSIGSGTLQLNGGTLKLNAVNEATNRSVIISGKPTIHVPTNSFLTFTGQVGGTGVLVKDGPGQLNFCYDGENSFAGLELRDGIVTQGKQTTTFCKKGGKITLSGGTLRLRANSAYETRPVYDYMTDVTTGTTSTLIGSSASAFSGSFTGSGNIVFVSGGARCDFFANMSNFTGTLKATGTEFRMTNNKSDKVFTEMRKGTLELGDGTKAGHYGNANSTEMETVMHLGALASDYATSTLGHSLETYYVGYNNLNTSYAGTLAAQQVVKVGTGILRLTGSAMGLLTVGEGALAGTAVLTDLVVNKGGSLLFELSANGCDMLTVTGSASLNNAVIKLQIAKGISLSEGQELKVLDCSSISGTFSVAADNVELDSSRLLSEGVLVVKKASTGIAGIRAKQHAGDKTYYNLSGQRVEHPAKGIYIVNGKKYIK